jgi:putative hydrolase
MGQYDPLLLADTDSHSLYFVRPNIQRVAEQLAVDYPRFRRWIAFHEVAHAAEFGAAPWLPGYLEDRMQAAVTDLTEGSLNREAYKELNTAMTAVEGYAELLMDQAFDEEYVDLRAKLDARRKGGGPFVQLMRRLLGLGLKRQQYERGADFFEAVADARGIAAASAVWERPENLPTDEELDHPGRWLHRVEE